MTTDPAILILASLADGDKHGYAMVQDIERFADVHLGPGTLYGALTRLEELGWIQPLEAEERRRPYRLTALGRSVLEEQAKGMDRVVRAALRRLKHA
jgi:DNA-binding PadR family transcriptional regulator